MTRFEQTQNLNFQVIADKPVIASDQPGQRILEIKVTAPEIQTQQKRPPLNLSLVIDRSGSMGGEKIHYARQAAAHIIDLLDEKDRAAVIIYDNNIDTLFPSQEMNPAARQEAKSRIMQIHSRGSTNLGDGWKRGCEEAARTATDSSFNRTLLLSDGLANVGETNIDTLSTHAHELNLLGFSTSTFGIGLDYDEHLMEAMANSGGGNYYFLEAISAIPHVFEREFEALKNTSLRDVLITLKLPAGVKAAVSGGWQTNLRESTLEISAGSLYSATSRSVYITLHHETSLQGAEIRLPITIRAKDIQDNLLEERTALIFKLVPAVEEKAVPEDKPLMGRFAEVDLADISAEAVRRERVGDRQGARSMMNDRVQHYASNVSKETSQRYTYMAGQMGMGLKEEDRKRYRSQSYDLKQSRFTTLDYPLKLVNGYPIALINGKYALIDTGSPFTLGNEPDWLFLNKLHTLAKDFGGVSAAYLTAEIGTHVDILLGTDILKNYITTIELQANLVHFSQHPLTRGGIRVPFTSLMGTPICQAAVNGVEQKMILDTGARLTYVDKALTAGQAPTGSEEDFYPTIGRFKTPVYELPVSIGGQQLTMRCGVLPPILEQAIHLTGASGIIGSQLYEYFTVILAFPENEIVLLPY